MNLPYVEIVKRVTFCAAHWYRRAEWSDAENQAVFYACANPHGHGHNYVLEVSIGGPCQPETGMVVNLTDVKHWLQAHVVQPLDHTNLNVQVPYFKTRIPTLENLGAYIWQRLQPVIEAHDGLRLTGLKLVENETLYMTCELQKAAPMPETLPANSTPSPLPVTCLTRKYDFSAAHRLYNPDYTDEQNWAVFGLCNNPNGHGHNYEIEITLTGESDPVTGMLVNIVELDEWVKQDIIRHVDHKHLNLDVPFFKGINPTAENIAIVFWQQLAPRFDNQDHCRLHRVRVIESKNNYADYFGPNLRL